jgi:tetratricopeptide (TPR) repeat protein
MSLFSKLAALAFKGAAGAAAGSLGFVGAGGAGEAVAEFLANRIHDHSTNLTEALDRAQARAWRAVELCLAGPSWWNTITSAFSSADERGFRDQVQAFLNANPLDGIDGHGPDFRAQCLAQLNTIRKIGLLKREPLDAKELAKQVGNLSRYGDASGAVNAEFAHLTEATAGLRREGYVALATFLELRPGGGPPLLVAALRYFFQREVEHDDELFRGLAYARLEALDAGQKQGFVSLGQALDSHAARLENMLADVQSIVVQTHTDVLDIKAEVARQGQQMQELGKAVLQALEQRQMQARELQGSDSLSIRDADERRVLRELVRRYRSLPPDQRKRMPALLNAVGKLQVVSGDFEEAERDFREAARMLDDLPARAEVSFNAYRAALERRAWDEALGSLREAVDCDPDRCVATA